MSFNTRSPAVKRLLKEAQELKNPTELFFAQPLDDNIFEWHFTIRGPSDSDFEGGIYHGRILLPAEYPMKPPSIILLTQNGRFKVNEKICLSISGHHPETWLPSWSIRTALLALIGFMPTLGEGAIGSLDYTAEERRSLAKKSLSYHCPTCKIESSSILPVLTEKSQQESAEAKELASQIDFKNSKPLSHEKQNVASSTPSTASETETTNAPSIDGSSEETSANLLTRRTLVGTSQQQHSETSSNSSNVSNTDTFPAPPPRTPTRARATNSLSRREENKLYIITITLLSIVFLFLLMRRIYLILESTSTFSI